MLSSILVLKLHRILLWIFFASLIIEAKKTYLSKVQFMGSQPFFIVPKITTEFFIQPKNHYHKKISKISLPKICFRIMIFWIFFTAVKIFLENFVVIFPKKNHYRGSDFFEKISPANFKNSPANNFGVQARLRTPVI